MTATFQNAAMVLSIGLFFSLMIAGLSNKLPATMQAGLTEHGVPTAAAHGVAALPPVAVLFAALLGYNPIQQLLGGVLGGLPHDQAAFLTGRTFFPQLVSSPFADGLAEAFWFAVIACLVAAVASWLCGPRRKTPGAHPESVGAEIAAASAESGTVPTELVDEAPVRDDEYAITGRVVGSGGERVGDCVVTVATAQGKQVARTSVDADGGYRIAGIPAGSYTLITTAAGYHPEAASVALNGHGAAHDFALRSNGGVLGTVRSAETGSPVPGAKVLAVDETGAVAADSTADGGGAFRLTDLPAGRYTIVASPANPAISTVDVDPQEPTTLDLDL